MQQLVPGAAHLAEGDGGAEAREEGGLEAVDDRVGAPLLQRLVLLPAQPLVVLDAVLSKRVERVRACKPPPSAPHPSPSRQ